jgi:ketosteroid isomerase-like protein
LNNSRSVAVHDAAHAAVAEREEALYRVQVQGDVNAIAPYLAEDLIYVHSTGAAESKSAYLAGVGEKLYEYGVIESRGKRIFVHDDVAIIDGTVDMTVSAKGAPKMLIHLLFCLVWSLEAGTWRLRYRQATRTQAASDAGAST